MALCAAHPLLPGFFFFCWGNSASNPPPPCRRFGVRNGPPFSQGCPNSPTSGSRMSSYRARRQGGDSKWRVSETAHVADYPGVSRRRTRPRIEDAAAGQFGGAETSCMLQISPPPPLPNPLSVVRTDPPAAPPSLLPEASRPGGAPPLARAALPRGWADRRAPWTPSVPPNTNYVPNKRW